MNAFRCATYLGQVTPRNCRFRVFNPCIHGTQVDLEARSGERRETLKRSKWQNDDVYKEWRKQANGGIRLSTTWACDSALRISITHDRPHPWQHPLRSDQPPPRILTYIHCYDMSRWLGFGPLAQGGRKALSYFSWLFCICGSSCNKTQRNLLCLDMDIAVYCHYCYDAWLWVTFGPSAQMEWMQGFIHSFWKCLFTCHTTIIQIKAPSF